MARFNQHYSEKKHKTRQYVFDQISTLNKRKIRILSLPANNFIFEKMVLEKYPDAIIDCMEINQSLFVEVKNDVPCKINYEFGDIFDKLQANPNTYDVVWLDLCGNLSVSNLNNLISAAQTTIKKKSIFAFTLSSSREQKSKVFTELYNCANMDNFRYKVFPKMLTKMTKIVHPNFTLQKILKYRNKGSRVPMSLYLFTNS
jgi:hypothetical protein